MVRLLMWAALIAAVIWFVKRLLNPPKPSRAQPPENVAAPMVRCAHCGVHLPRDRAINQEPQWYCSEAHRLEGPAARDR
ncbi:PP0621 family protein [Pseudomonas californiensis]|uniref:PP0621 family protein n=1 Tax=Pseudomonas californiensis TaxID=2829823 RepID=UPI0022287207|nr:PP0621 family protein [Pseudomonas californiensis]